MWILGVDTSVLIISDNTSSNQFYYLDLCTNCIYHGVDWIYTFVEDLNPYDIKVWYFWFLNLIFQESFSLFVNSYWYLLLDTSDLQFAVSVYLDMFLEALNNKTIFNDDWFKSYLSSVDTNSTLYYYPELLNINNSVFYDLLFSYTTYERVVIEYLLNSENLLTSVMLFPQYILFILLLTVLFVLYFQFFTTGSKEESLIDQDYLTSSNLLEAEEEISALDDVLGALIVFVYVFFWFFYIYIWSATSYKPELILAVALAPFIYIIIFLIPLNLLYDFGTYFSAYLRGSASTPNMLFEIMYDYIAIFALFIRLFVQGVRLLLMLFVYASLHDYVLYWSWHSKFWLYGSYDIWKDISILEFTYDSISYFVMKLPSYAIYWVYELAHTFFVITGQFIAFFAMVFWLFFYLYTFFNYEPHEEYMWFLRRHHTYRIFLEKIKFLLNI